MNKTSSFRWTRNAVVAFAAVAMIGFMTQSANAQSCSLGGGYGGFHGGHGGVVIGSSYSYSNLGYGSGLSHSTYYPSYGGSYWHDTTYYNYRPSRWVYEDYDYLPSNWHLHRTGHWHW